MKVLLINGSPHEHGCTRAALDEVARTLSDCGVETELINIGTAAAGCGRLHSLRRLCQDRPLRCR